MYGTVALMGWNGMEWNGMHGPISVRKGLVGVGVDGRQRTGGKPGPRQRFDWSEAKSRARDPERGVRRARWPRGPHEAIRARFPRFGEVSTTPESMRI